MKRIRFLITALAVSLPLSITELRGAEGIISKQTISGSNHCWLKFPAISEETLFSDRPELTDPSEGDIIDFYGPCDHDPLGKPEVAKQRADLRRERQQDRDPD